jgi:outer membrane cobalamin receptor
MGLSIVPALEIFFKFNAHYGNNTRFPTFNERYYSSLYSHYELNPESYETFDAGLDIFFNLFGGTSLSAAYFFIDGNDKIIWIPTRLALQTPRNISRVNTSGIELSVNKKIIEDKLDLTFFYNYTDARNKTQISANDLSYNKQLIYSPAHRFNFNISATLSSFQLSLFSSFISERFYTTDNNRNYLLPEYYVIDFSSSYKFNLFDRSHSFSFTIYNLLDEEYLIIQSYPMPLRTYLITLNMELL